MTAYKHIEDPTVLYHLQCYHIKPYDLVVKSYDLRISCYLQCYAIEPTSLVVNNKGKAVMSICSWTIPDNYSTHNGDRDVME